MNKNTTSRRYYGSHPSLWGWDNKWNGSTLLQRHSDGRLKSCAISQLLSHIRCCRAYASQDMSIENLQVSSVKSPCLLHQILHEDLLHTWEILLLTALRVSLYHLLQLHKPSMELEGKGTRVFTWNHLQKASVLAVGLVMVELTTQFFFCYCLFLWKGTL